LIDAAADESVSAMIGLARLSTTFGTVLGDSLTPVLPIAE